MSEVPPLLPWTRYWLPRGQTPNIENGYLSEKPSPRNADQRATLSELSRVRCLVLLGDVGMGKSTALATEAARLKESRTPSAEFPEILFADLKGQNERTIERRIIQSAAFSGWVAGSHPLVLMLDSLDECWRRVTALSAELASWLEAPLRKSHPPFFFRLTCRSAEWREELERELRKIFPKDTDQSNDDPLSVRVLAPLSRADVSLKAASRGLDGEKFLAEVAARDAQPLAAHPITLDMLVGLASDGRGLPDTRTETYEQGCLRLCTDRHTESAYQRITSAPQRLALASRIASASVLGNKYLINPSPEHAVASNEVLEAAELVGYFPEPAGGEVVTVNRDTLVEALQTALFSERVFNVQNWRHQSYAEFLAARHLASRDLSLPKLIPLLTDNSQGTPRIIPQLDEIACWVADLRPDFFSAVAPHNADIFLRCDQTRLTTARRVVLVESYFRQTRASDTAAGSWEDDPPLERLIHPGLADQVRAVLLDPDESPQVLRLARDFARKCELRELAPVLVDFFLDATRKQWLRVIAGRLLCQFADDALRAVVKAKAVSVFTDDRDDELRGCYLELLWPSHLTIAETLSLLDRPQRDNFSGLYVLFVSQSFPEKISDGDLPAVLEWFQTTKRHIGRHSLFEHLAQRLVYRAYLQLSNPDILQAFVSFVESHNDDSCYFVCIRPREVTYETPRDLVAERLSRLQFWAAFVLRSDDPRMTAIRCRLRESMILVPDDLPWFLEQSLTAENDSTRARWRDLAFSVFHFSQLDQVEAVYAAGLRDPDIAAMLVARTSNQLVPEDKNWQKEQHYNAEKHATEKAARQARRIPLGDFVSQQLAKFEQGEERGMWNVIRAIGCFASDEDETRPAVTHARFSDNKLWAKLPLSLQSRILDLAPRFLQDARVTEEMPWNTTHDYYACNTAIHLLVMLGEFHSLGLESLTVADWAHWSPTLVTYYGKVNGNKEQVWCDLFGHAFSRAPEVLLPSISRLLDTNAKESSLIGILPALTKTWGTDLDKIVSGLVQRADIELWPFRSCAEFLSEHSPESAIRALQPIAEDRRHRHCAVANAYLFPLMPEQWGVNLFNAMRTDDTFGVAVLGWLASDHSAPKGSFSNLSAATTANWWDWLANRFTRDPYSDEDHDGTVTLEHEVNHLKNGLLHRLENAGSPESLAAIADLIRRRPEDRWLSLVLARARKNLRRASWTPLPVPQLMKLLAEPEARIICTPQDLRELLIESLKRYQLTLRGENPSTDLWNSVPVSRALEWSPKPEIFLSVCLKRHFERDLAFHGVTATCEPETRMKLGTDPAEWLDLLVMAPKTTTESGTPEFVKAIVEVKCSWNDGFIEDLSRQLADRYVRHHDCHCGLYVAVYFTCNAWNRPKDPRRSGGFSRESLETVDKLLSAKASNSPPAELAYFVLNAGLSD